MDNIYKGKNKSTFLILGLITILGFLNYFKEDLGINTNTETKRSELPFTYNKLHLTKHAKDRMFCRTITEDEINYVLANGVINMAKTDINLTSCESKYAVEGASADGQEISLIVSPCDNILNVVTVIDLEQEYECE